VRRLRALCAVVALLASSWVLGADGDAAELTDASWWWFGNQGPAPIPAPPTVPEGGLLVAGAADGAKAIAAVRFSLAEGESNPTLTLAVAENGDQGGEGAVLGACVAGSAWGGGEKGGPWEAKPNAACSTGSVQGIRAEDGKSWTFGLAPLVVSGEVNVVITPGMVTPEAPVGSTFSLAFAPPTTAALTTTPGESSSSSGLFVDPATDFADEPVGALADDSSQIFSADTVNAFTPSLPETSQGLTPTAPAVRQTTASNVVPPKPSGRSSAVAFLVLVMAVAVMVRLNKIPVPGLRRLGPLASGPGHAAPVVATTPELGGLGRFARRRTGTPPPLV
jgi:hypothetical protein